MIEPTEVYLIYFTDRRRSMILFESVIDSLEKAVERVKELEKKNISSGATSIDICIQCVPFYKTLEIGE